MNAETEFRTQEQEIVKLVEEYAELKRTLKLISGQLSRMETRVQRAFPAIAQQQRAKKLSIASKLSSDLSPEQALNEFDRVVELTTKGASEEAEKIIGSKSLADLTVIAKELGIPFKSSTPSARALREGIFGKVRESVLLSRHHVRS